MNWIRFSLLLIILFPAQAVFSEELFTEEPRWIELGQAHGFIIGQDFSLELINQKFPDLNKDVRYACYAFNSSALREGAEGVRQELLEFFKKAGASLVEYEVAIIQEIKSQINEEITHDQAVAFLQEVHQRAKGDLPGSILATLLSAHPDFSEHPELELLRGWKQTFRTKNHPKAQGVDFSISYPASWIKKQGYNDLIIQEFESKTNSGVISSSLLVSDITEIKMSNIEARKLLLPDQLELLVPDGGRVIESKKIILDGMPAGMLISELTEQRLDIEMTQRMTQFITLHDQYMIFINFGAVKIPTRSLSDIQLCPSTPSILLVHVNLLELC